MTVVGGVAIPAVRLWAALLTVLLYGLMCGAIALRERRRAARERREAAALATAPPGAAPPLLLAYASQTGQAEAIARETARLLHAAGEAVELCALQALEDARLAAARRALFVVSTYGEGDAPDNAGGFLDRLVEGAGVPPPPLGHLRYGLLALGDRQYTHFCGFGRQLDGWLQARGAVPLFERIEMDNGDAAALAAWQRRLAELAAVDEPLAAGWRAPEFSPWTLVARQHLNPGSQGAPVFHLEFAPPAPDAAVWESGDLAQVRVPADADRPRDYSIASVAGDGRVHLTMRQSVREDGTPGVASGWLCAGLPVGGTVEMRLRPHGNFRLGENAARPLILVGNGTGIAGLRSHLRARAAAGQAAPHWLVFGERQRSRDYLYRAEIEAWRADGTLRRLDLAFSRDGSERAYVQDLLALAAADLRTWVEQGAAIYVCGSRQGMAQGVHAALRAALGNACLDLLAQTGRYRRDVY
ncbi:sulfite reductase subunit alpha [Acidovorax sp. FG27]|uniref:sulfite reductase subunit alpha n=1 Tax=Acidovorax sp. FG27 TaxID=3133652 RepID=UPI0030E8BD0E